MTKVHCKSTKDTKAFVEGMVQLGRATAIFVSILTTLVSIPLAGLVTTTCGEDFGVGILIFLGFAVGFVLINLLLVALISSLIGRFKHYPAYCKRYAELTDEGIQGQGATNAFRFSFDQIRDVYVVEEVGLYLAIDLTKVANRHDYLAQNRMDDDTALFLIANIGNAQEFCDKFWEVSGKSKPEPSIIQQHYKKTFPCQ